MTDTFVTNLKASERAATQKEYSKLIKDAIRAGMSSDGDIMKRYAKIIGNVTDVANEMAEQARVYDKNKG